MLVTPVAIAALILAGARMASLPVKLKRRMVVVTVLVATALHVSVTWALSTQRIEDLAREFVYGNWGALALVVVALAETAGLWVPVVALPWANAQRRALAGGSIVAAGTLAARAYYFPFDVVVMNDEVVSPSRLEYGLTLVMCLPFFAVGYALGWFTRRRSVARGDSLTSA